jgi:membrane associated rhomboid family serine protease
MQSLGLALLIVIFSGIFVFLIGIPVFAAVQQKRRDRRRIMADGKTAVATITTAIPDTRPGLCRVGFTFQPEMSGPQVECRQRTTLAALKALGLDVGSQVQVHYLSKWPRHAFIDTLVVKERLEELNSAAAGSNAEEGVPPSVHFVSYSNPSGQMTAANAFRWIGDGNITIGRGVVEFTALRGRPFWFSKRTQEQFPLSAVSNVEVFKGAISCAISAPNAKPRTLQFWAVNPQDAEAIAALLPESKTPDFAPKLAEAAAFQARLVEVTPQALVTPALIGINIILFIVTAYLGGGILVPNAEVLIRLGSDYTPLTSAGQWWRLFTSMFLHFGLLHLAFNMWALWANGVTTERLYGSTRYLALYLVAGVAGSLTSFLWHPFVNGAGASGAIFGVLGALFAYFLRTDSGVPKSVLTAQRNTAAIFIVISILNAARVQGIDNAAHLGGLAAGFVMGLILYRPLDAKRDERDWSVQWLGALGVIVASVLIVRHYLYSGELHPRVLHDPSGRPILLTELAPPPRTYGGATLGMTVQELLQAKGTPIRIEPDHWYYNSIDRNHDGVVEIAFQKPADGKSASVWAILYWGDVGSEPSGLANLLGFSREDLVVRYGTPSGDAAVGDDQPYLYFRNGILVSLRAGKVQAYGVYTPAQ